GGLLFSADTELQRHDGGYSGGALLVDFTFAQRLARGFIQARIPVHFALRKSELRRERLGFSRTKGGALEVVNGLGTDVVRLTVDDAEGFVWTLNDLPAGA